MNLWNRILVALDEQETSLSAVRYLAAVLGGSATCKIRLVAVHMPTPEDDPQRSEEIAGRVTDRAIALEERLLEAERILVEARLPQENLTWELVEADGSRGVGEEIMARQREGGYGTVVVGRRGRSKTEEFLFGSVSSTVVRQATDCCIWVVS
jgi:nucleotide-binding universal stress UspA family protein